MDEDTPEEGDREAHTELIGRLLFPDSEEDWEEAKAENDAAPREPGRYKIEVGGKPHHYVTDVDCPNCGKHLHGEGVSFVDSDDERFKCKMHPDIPDCLVIHVHWGEDCPALKYRLWRAKRAVTWPIERRYRSWKWRRKAKQERADPSAWARYWAERGD